MIKYLLGKASTGKFRFAVVECDEEWHEPVHGYVIQRSYGQVGGKTTLSPKIIVDRTKQKRTWKEEKFNLPKERSDCSNRTSSDLDQ